MHNSRLLALLPMLAAGSLLIAACGDDATQQPATPSSGDVAMTDTTEAMMTDTTEAMMTDTTEAMMTETTAG